MKMSEKKRKKNYANNRPFCPQRQYMLLNNYYYRCRKSSFFLKIGIMLLPLISKYGMILKSIRRTQILQHGRHVSPKKNKTKKVLNHLLLDIFFCCSLGLFLFLKTLDKSALIFCYVHLKRKETYCNNKLLV